MPSMPWESNGTGPATAAEQRLDEAFGQIRTRSSRRESHESDATTDRLDIHAAAYEPESVVRAEYLIRKLIESESDEEGGWRPFARRAAQSQVIRVRDTVIVGTLDLRATDLTHLLEFTRCRFEETPDLRQATLAGLVLTKCWFPGLRARNLRTSNDVLLLGCTSHGDRVDLTDAQLGGSLELNDSVLSNRHRRAMHADRLTVSGALLAMRMRVTGELRLPGANVAGNLNLCGATLHNPGGVAVNANGVQIGGSLRCHVDPNTRRPFTAEGLLYLTSAHIKGDLRLRDAVLAPGSSARSHDVSSHDDPVATLVLDRAEIIGDAQLDNGLRSQGTIRMVNARIGGNLRLGAARVEVSQPETGAKEIPDELNGLDPTTDPFLAPDTHPARSLHLSGIEVQGNLEANSVDLRGQVRMTDAVVRGNFHLSRSRIIGPRLDVLQANRIRVGGNLECRETDIEGTAQLQGARIGANLDLRSTTLTRPAWRPHRNTYKSSLDIRAASVGRDLVCAEGTRPFRADGEIHLRRTSIGRQANFWGCRLGDDESSNALNAFGLAAQEITLRPQEPPCGRIVLRQAQCELLDDNAELWAATGGVDVEGFVYNNFARPIKPTDRERVWQRVEWLRDTVRGGYLPGPYDQLASVFRANGNEEHAIIVLAEKQRRRYQAMAGAARPILRPLIRMWSGLQRLTVNYGYRPVRALLWLLVLAAGGTAWFDDHPLHPVNHEEDPVWNPFLYTVDQLLPVINLGYKGMFRPEGGSQWVTVVLIASGWILATTVAAGITRALKREK